MLWLGRADAGVGTSRERQFCNIPCHLLLQTTMQAALRRLIAKELTSTRHSMERGFMFVAARGRLQAVSPTYR